MNPKVSVIIPVYNAEEFLSECLQSVISQTLWEIEIVLINDGSNDNSINIIREFEKNDPRLIVIDKENEGAGPSRNRGIMAAHGEFIAFMDADDYYPNNDVLEKLYLISQKENCLIVGGKRIRKMEDGSLSYDPDTLEIFGQRISPKGLTLYKDYQYDYGYTQFIYNRQMLMDNNLLFPPFRRYQDPPFFVNAMITAERFYYVDFPTYCFRRVFMAEVTKYKWNTNNAIDMINGITTNLVVSQKYGLAKLHYITANRLNQEGSFMAINVLKNEVNCNVLSALIEANHAVNVKWLKENGYELPEPFVLDVFKYAVETAKKYEDLRNNKILKLLRGIKRNG